VALGTLLAFAIVCTGVLMRHGVERAEREAETDDLIGDRTFCLWLTLPASMLVMLLTGIFCGTATAGNAQQIIHDQGMASSPP